MSTITINNTVLSAPSSSKIDNLTSITVDEVKVLEDEDARTFHDTDAAYVLPNDNVEHQRLELQHRLLRQIMGDKVFHAPLSKDAIHKTLDIGCGTGAVTHEMASTFPDAHVFGADLSPVPQVRRKLPNIEYIQGNIMDLSDERFEEGSFDLIFSRLLVLGMSNWKGYIERCVALAKPGAWIEMHDFSNMIHHVPAPISSLAHLRPHQISIPQLASATHPTDAFHHAVPWAWDAIFARLLAQRDVDIYCGAKIGALFADAGLVDVCITRYMVPYSRWEGLTSEERQMADYLESFVRDVIPVAIRRAGENAGPGCEEDVEEAVRDVERYCGEYEGGRNFLWLYVVCGRKPL